MVGAVRFELTTSWTRTKRASQATLRPAIEPNSLPLNCRIATKKKFQREKNFAMQRNCIAILLQVSIQDYAFIKAAPGLFFSAFLATLTNSVNAAESCAAMSARTFRSSTHFAALRPSMNRL